MGIDKDKKFWNKIFNVFVIGMLLFTVIPVPVSATTTASMVWKKDLVAGVTSVDTNEDGSLVIAGLDNGTIVAYDNSGNLQWQYDTGSSNPIHKVVSDGSGNTAWIIRGAGSRSGYINTTGVIESYNTYGSYNITDVAITRDGNYYAVSQLIPGKIFIYKKDGELYASNQSYANNKWELIGYDPYNNWITSVNRTDYRLYGWGILSQIGWDANNLLKDVFHPFDYGSRRNITITNTPQETVLIQATSCATAVESGYLFKVPASDLYNETIVVTNYSESMNSTGNYISNGGYNVLYSNVFPVDSNITQFISVGRPPWRGDGQSRVGGTPSFRNVTDETKTNGLLHSSANASANLNSQPIVLASGRIIALNATNKNIWASDNFGLNWSIINSSTWNPFYTVLTSAQVNSLHGFYLVNSSFPNGIKYIYISNDPETTTGYVFGSTDPEGKVWNYEGVATAAEYNYRNNMWSAHSDDRSKMYIWGGTPATAGGTPVDTVSYTVDGLNWTRVGHMNVASMQPANTGFGDFKINGWYLRTCGSSSILGANSLSYRTRDFVTWENTTYTAPMTGGATAGWNSISNDCVGIYNNVFYLSSITYYTYTYYTTNGANWSVYTGHSSNNNFPYAFGTYTHPTCVQNVTPLQPYPQQPTYTNGSILIGKAAGQDLNVTIYYNITGLNITFPVKNATKTTYDELMTGTISQVEYAKPIHYLNKTTNASLGTAAGFIQAIDVPELGGWVGASTSEPKVYHQQVNAKAVSFGSQYSGSANSGTSRDIAIADSAAYTIEGRDLIADIYQLDGTRKGTYTSGGLIKAVDFAVRNGLWAIAGGDDGKVYIFSKDATSAWYVFYQGDSDQPISATAMSWRGEYAAVGRTDGSLEYYTTSAPAASTTYAVNVFVNKGGAPYQNATITVTSGTSASVTLTPVSSGETDSTGKYVFSAEDAKYYKVDVNSGEYIYIYQASSTYPTITINIPSAIVSRPYNYAASFNDTTNVVTTTYDDVNSAIVNITITNTNTNKVVHLANYTGTSITDTYTGVGSNQYRINLNFTRTTGHTYSDTLYVKSSLYNKVTHTPAQWVLFEYAAYSVFLMLVALGIGTTSLKYGAVVLPALTVLGIMMGFLPVSIYTVGLFVSAFIAMLEVMRRRSD